MKRKSSHLGKLAFTHQQHLFTGVKVKYFILMIIICLQFKISGLAQQNTTMKLPAKSDTAFSGDSKNMTAPPDSSGNYSKATFPGGDRAFMKYLLHNLRMPDYYTKKEDVRIFVTFTIDESGELKNFRASDAPHVLKKEAINVIKNSGRWIPAYKDGTPVASERQQPISFFIN